MLSYFQSIVYNKFQVISKMCENFQILMLDCHLLINGNYPKKTNQILILPLFYQMLCNLVNCKRRLLGCSFNFESNVQLTPLFKNQTLLLNFFLIIIPIYCYSNNIICQL